MRTRLVLLVLAALALAACGDATDPVGLSVNGTEISRADLEDQIDELVDAGVLPVGQGESTADAEGIVGYLNALVADQIIKDELDELGVEVTDEDRAPILQQAEADPTFGDLPESVRRLIIGLNARQAALASQLTERTDDVPEVDTVEAACGSHILVETEDEAVEIILELGDGADFATVAAERSIDTGSGAQGGSLGCTPRGQFVEPFEEAMFNADPGELVGPIETEFGFHVIVLDEIQEIPDPSAPPPPNPLDALLTEQLLVADVEVDSRYGTWNAEIGQIEAPEGAVTPTTEPLVPGGLPGTPAG